MSRFVTTIASACALVALAAVLPAQAAGKKGWKELNVTASAYTIAEDETKKGNIGLAAWGDILKPGMKAIAVSRDLIKQYGLGHESRVKIEGLPGTYIVRDKMNKRWRKKIDLLVPSKRHAREWGKRKVRIQWLAGE